MKPVSSVRETPNPVAGLAEIDIALIRACDLANQDTDVAEIEREFNAISDEIAEPCSDSGAG